MLKLTTGSVVKIWHGTRGHDYVVAGYNARRGEIGLIKHTCIKNDGTLHESTKQSFRRKGEYHSVVKVTDLMEGAKEAPAIVRVVGTREVNRAAMVDIVTNILGKSDTALQDRHSVYPCTEGHDARVATTL